MVEAVRMAKLPQFNHRLFKFKEHLYASILLYENAEL